MIFHPKPGMEGREMKMRLLMIAILFSGCAHAKPDTIRYVHVPDKAIDRPWADLGITVLATVTGVAVHTLGQGLYLQVIGADWNVTGINEKIYSVITENEMRWAGRSGFIAGLGAQWLSNKISPNSRFTREFNKVTASKIIAYPIVGLLTDDTDLTAIGDTSLSEWVLYSALSMLPFVGDEDK